MHHMQAEAEYWRRSEGYRVGRSDQILGFDCGGEQWVLEVAFPTGTLRCGCAAELVTGVHGHRGAHAGFVGRVIFPFSGVAMLHPAGDRSWWQIMGKDLRLLVLHTDNPSIYKLRRLRRHECRRPSGADLDFMRELMALLEAEGIAAPAPIEQRWSASSRWGRACASCISLKEPPCLLHCMVQQPGPMPAAGRMHRELGLAMLLVVQCSGLPLMIQLHSGMERIALKLALLMVLCSAPMSPAAARGDPDTLHSWVGIIMYLPTSDPAQRQAITDKCARCRLVSPMHAEASDERMHTSRSGAAGCRH